METLYRVLFTPGTEVSTLALLLVTEVEGFDSAPQEFCGYGAEGDFSDSEDNGRAGEVWEFVTDRPAAMEQTLNSDPAVIAWARKG